MANLFPRIFKQKGRAHISEEEVLLEQFFTNAEQARQTFERLTPKDQPSKRILVIHGVGGVGKSTLLKMYRLSCHKQNIPVGLANSDVHTPVDTLVNWDEDFQKTGVDLSAFQGSLARYQALQAKVNSEAAKLGKPLTQLSGKLGKAAVKTAIQMAVSTIPVIGPLVSGLSGEGAEALIDWLHSFLSKPDLDLFLDPSSKLTSTFLSDLNKVAKRQRVVLMIDTYEQMVFLNSWLCKFAKSLAPNVLLVIAGREIPHWEKEWAGWMSLAEILELKEMKPEDIRTLVFRYNQLIRGADPDPKQLEAIVQFARGFPLAATTVVQLWVKYGVEDFQTVRPQVVADLVDRFLEGIPKKLQAVFEIAAIVRYFNIETLESLLKDTNYNEMYGELRHWPFILPQRGGFRMHDSMRAMMLEDLRTRSPQRYRLLHVQALGYYQGLLPNSSGEERNRYSLELIYHAVCSDESEGIQLFQGLAEELVNDHLGSYLRVLLNDANAYPLSQTNCKLWRDYYSARLAHLEERPADELQIYELIINNEQADSKLLAYTHCDLGFILTRGEFLEQPGGTERAKQVLNKSLEFVLQDSHLISSYLWLYRISIHTGSWEEGIGYLSTAVRFYEEHKDYYGLINAHLHSAFLFTLRGMWVEFFEAWNEASSILSRFTPKSKLPKATILSWGVWPFSLAGRFQESEKMAREALGSLRELKDELKTLIALRDLGWTLGLQGKCEEAEKCIGESVSKCEELGELYSIDLAAGLGFWGAILGKRGEFGRSEQCLIRSLEIKESVNDIPAMQETLVWLGQTAEMQKKWEEASGYYQRCVDWGWYGNNYFDCAALTGLARVKAVLGDYGAALRSFNRAEQLAIQYDYNDYLAALKVLQAQFAWQNKIAEWGDGFQAAERHFQLALVYALRYNRFLLDELIGNGIHSPFRSVFSICHEHAREGRQMLLNLRHFWQDGLNITETSREKTVSPIPMGQSLLSAEKIARKMEPGDGSEQVSVISKIDSFLENYP